MPYKFYIWSESDNGWLDFTHSIVNSINRAALFQVREAARLFIKSKDENRTKSFIIFEKTYE